MKKKLKLGRYSAGVQEYRLKTGGKGDKLMWKFVILSGLSAALLAGAFGFAEAQTGTGGGGGGGTGTRPAPTTTTAPATTTTAPARTTTAPATTTACPPGLLHKPKNHPGRMAHPGCK